MNKTLYKILGAITALMLTVVNYSITKASAPVSNASNAPAGYTSLIFEDNFDAWNSVWHRGHWWTRDGSLSATNTNEQQAYAPANVTVNNGLLNIAARKETVTVGTKTYYYTSGLIETGGDQYGYPNKFTFQYGYMEARIKIPSGQGLWPAFWLWPANYQDPPETDIMEIIGSRPQENNMTIHSTSGDTGYVYTGPDFSQGFHIYASEWTPTYIAWFVDGVEVARFSDASRVPQQPMYLLLNLAVGGDWPGPVSDSVLPAAMQVDWVRVYQKSTATPTATLAPATNTATQAPTNTSTATLASPTYAPTSTSQPPSPTPTAPASPAPATATDTPASIPLTPTAQATIQSPLETVYDNKNSAFVYSSGWKDVNNSKAYNGSYKQTSTTNSSTTLAFTGQTFSILYTSGSGFSRINIYVDGVLIGTLNERTSKVRYQQRWNYSGRLSPGSHTLQLVFLGSSKTRGSLDAVIVK